MPAELVKIVYKAGLLIMDIYQEKFDVNTKTDNSPVTIADKNAEELILNDLCNIFPDIPVVSEEAYSNGILPDFNDKFFLVDLALSAKNKRSAVIINIPPTKVKLFPKRDSISFSKNNPTTAAEKK